MLIRFTPDSHFHRYFVLLGSSAIDCSALLRWVYPSVGGGESNSALYQSRRNGECHYADPPSDVLKSLIAAAAPWYAVLDRLIEEYPQWQQHFEAAAAAERVRQQPLPHTSVS